MQITVKTKLMPSPEQKTLLKQTIVEYIVEYVNPKHTSQKCPECGKLNKVNNRKYKCSCSYETHRDRVGAVNIITAPVADGNSLSA